METNLVVIYHYKLSSHVSEQDFLQQHERVMQFMKSQPGHMYTSLSRDEQDTWVDINYWSGAENLENANRAFEANEDCKKFIAQLYPKSISMEQSELLTNSRPQ